MPKAQSISGERRSKRQEDEAKRKQREADEAAAEKRLEEEKAALEKKEREDAKKARAKERASEEDKAKAAKDHAEASKYIYEEAKKRAQERILAAKQAEEEEEAAARKANTMDVDEETGKKDVPSDDINALLSDLNTTGTGEDTNMKEPEEELDLTKDDSSESEGDLIKSPEKKKTKKDKREKKEAKKAAKKAAKEQAKAATAAEKEKAKEGPASILKKSRATTGVRVTEARKKHVHKFSRQIVNTSIVLDAAGGRPARIAQYTRALKSLVDNCLLLDPNFQIEPRDPLTMKPPIYSSDGINDNHAVLSFHIRSSGGSEQFDMQKPRKQDKKKGSRRRNQANEDSDDEEQDLVFPQVYFDFACSCDMNPTELFECVGIEWGRLGGAKVYLKAFNTFDTDTTAMVLKSWNRLSTETFLEEFKVMFQEAKEVLRKQTEDGGHAYENYELPIPMMRTRLMNPKLTGQDTTPYSGWSTAKAFKRKAIHIEAERSMFEHIHEVIAVMKSSGIVKKYWGKNAHITPIERAKEDVNRIVILPGDLQRLSSMARDHVNFNASMCSNVLTGVEKLDKSFTFHDATDPNREAGTVTLRHLLYNYVFMPDGHSLFVEIHQRTPVSDVEVIVPNTPAALDMLAEMNRNSAAFLFHYFQDYKIPTEFVTEVVKGSMDPLLCRHILKSKWDPVARKMTLPQDEEEKAIKALAEAAWYKDEFGSHMKDKSRKEAREEFADEAFLYDHDGDKSVKTIHSKKGTSEVYKGSPHAPTFSLGRPEAIHRSGDDDVQDDISAISEMSKVELVAMCKALKIQQKAASQNQGSPPDISNNKASGMATRDGSKDQSAETISSGDSSSSSSDSSAATDDSGTTKAGKTSTTAKGGSVQPSQASKGE